MKHTGLVYLILLVMTLASCGAKDNPNTLIDTQFASEINDSAHIFSPKTYSYLKNIKPPLGIKPVIVAVEKIEDAEMGTFADDLFGEYCKKKYSGNTFKNRGILIVASKNPELVQVRVGGIYDVYCRMHGSAAGADYLKMQYEVAERSIDEMCPVALNNVIRDIEECRQLPWHKRLALKMSFMNIEKFMDDLATPSRSFFSQFYFRPYLFLVGWVKSFMGNWIMAFLAIAVFYIIVKGWIEKKINKYIFRKADRDARDICRIDSSRDHTNELYKNFNYYSIIKDIIIFLIKLIITFPTLAAISVLSTSRMEDIIALKYAHIPSIHLAENLTGWSNNPPTFWLVILLIIIYYIKFLFCWEGIYTLGHLSDRIQVHIYKTVSILHQLADDCITYGHNRKYISKLFNGLFKVLVFSWMHNFHEVEQPEVDDQNTESNDSSKPQKRPIDEIFLDKDSELYRQSPYLAVMVNVHGEALFLVFFVGLIASTILSYTYAIYFLLLWLVQLTYRVIMEIISIRQWKKQRKIQEFQPFRLIKKVWLTDVIFLAVMTGLFFLVSPPHTAKSTEAIAEVQQALPDDLTGLYFVSKADGVIVKGVTARIVEDQHGNYFMQVYSDQPMRRFALQLDKENGIFHCDVLGDGYITYDKQVKSININFSDLWILTN